MLSACADVEQEDISMDQDEIYIGLPSEQRFVNYPTPKRGVVAVEGSALIYAEQARFAYSVTGRGCAVAILDTGINASHEDFGERIVATLDFTDSDQCTQESPFDRHGHGTHVAGIIAANGSTVGVAPEAEIVSAKVIPDDGLGNISAVENALKWIIANQREYGICAVNMSLGDRENWKEDTRFRSNQVSQHIRTLYEMRVPVITAAGNNYHNWESQPGMMFPAVLAETISVGAVYDSDIGPITHSGGAEAYSTDGKRIAAFSQRLSSSSENGIEIDVFAPGSPILSTGNIGLRDQQESRREDSGTSQAAPFVTGTVLLIQELHRARKEELPTIEEVRKYLRAGPVISDGDDEDDNVVATDADYRLLNVLQSLEEAKVSAL